MLRLFQSKMESLDSETLFQLSVGATAGFAPTTVTNRIFFVTPWKINVLSPKMEVWKMTFLFNWMTFSFHLNFHGCSGFKGSWFPWGKVKQRSKEERTGRVLIQLKLGVDSMKGAKNGACLLFLMCFLRGQQLRPFIRFCFPDPRFSQDIRGRIPQTSTFQRPQTRKNFWIIWTVDQLGLQNILQAYFSWLMVFKQILPPHKKKTKPF